MFIQDFVRNQITLRLFFLTELKIIIFQLYFLYPFAVTKNIHLKCCCKQVFVVDFNDTWKIQEIRRSISLSGVAR